MTSSHYDLVVIGSGSGNSLVPPGATDHRVAVVEAGTFGGTCLNVGCIPTKMFVYAADVALTIREAARYGVDATLDQVRWADVRDRVFSRIDPISAAGQAYRVDGPGTTAYLGRARFTGPRELEVTGLPDGGSARISGEQVVIATGSRPVVPAVIAEAGVPFHTSDTVMRLDALPRSMVVLGGGYIAAELAHVFSALGVRVTILTRGQAMLRHLDDDIVTAFGALAATAWDLRLGVEVSHARAAAGGGVHLDLTDGSTADGEVLLVATGRVPRTEEMGLDVAGVAVHPDGRIVADPHGRTTAEGVWTLGDASSEHQLKHVANHEARVVAHNLAHPGELRRFDHRAVPSAIFTHPQIATVGLTEAQAREAGYDVVTATQHFGDTAYGWAMEDTTSIAKLVADRGSARLLGAHLMGPQSSLLIQPLIPSVTEGRPVEGLARGQYWIHPALTEVVENALLKLGLGTN